MRVLREDRIGVEGLAVQVKGGGSDLEGQTAKGFAAFEALTAGTYSIALPAIPDQYEKLRETTKTVEVKKGSTQVVSFKLQRRAALKIHLVEQGSLDKVVEDVAAKITWTRPDKSTETLETAKGSCDFGYVSVGQHKLEVAFSNPTPNFALVKTSEEFELAGGDERTVVFELQPLVKLEMKLVFKGPLQKLAENPVVKVTKTGNGGDPVSQDTDKGITSFGYLPVGKYKLTVELKATDKNSFELSKAVEEVELKAGEDRVVGFPIEPLYKTVRFIAHCLVTVAKQIWTDDGKEELGKQREIWEKTDSDYEVLNSQMDVGDEKIRLLLPGAENTWMTQSGSPYWRARYMGLPVEMDDVNARVALIQKTLEKARASVEEKDDELKIFMMPECFFWATYGAYEVETVSALVGELQQLVKGADWRHWVFVFGTVNGVYYQDGDDMPRKVEGLFNIAPVIRGGSQDAEGADYTKTVLKTTFCADLLSSSDLEAPMTSPVGSRTPAPTDSKEKAGEAVTTEAVGFGFGATENEVLLGKKVQELLRDPEPNIQGDSITNLFLAEGLTAQHWIDLKRIVRAAMGNGGMISAIRQLRAFKVVTGIKLDRLNDCEFYGLQLGKFDTQGKQEIIAIKKTWADLAKRLLDEVIKVEPKFTLTDPPAFTKKTALPNWKNLSNAEKLPKLQAILELCDTTPMMTGLDFQRAALKTMVQAMIDQVAVDNVTMLNEMLNGRGAQYPWQFGWVPTFHRVLQLFLAGEAAVLVDKPKFVFEDFSFTCRRKPGPWLAQDEAADEKKLYFGLEICADHSEGRLLGIIQKMPTKPSIDIQLVPSAGMGITDIKIVARADGFVFNSDGWNAVASMLKVLKSRNAKVLDVKEDTWPMHPGHNPLFPHSELVKSTGEGKKPEPIIPPTVIALDELKTDAAQLFAYGPGELHIYPAQNLPDPV